MLNNTSKIAETIMNSLLNLSEDAYTQAKIVGRAIFTSGSKKELIEKVYEQTDAKRPLLLEMK